jgi:hypothetical protein
MSLRWIATLALLIALPLVAAGDTERKWKLVSDRDDIQIYMAHNDDSRIKTFRGVTVLEMNDFYSNIALLDDYEFYSRWLYLISELSEVRRRSPVDRDVLVRTKLPFVANRDAGLHLTVEQNPQTLEINIRFRAKEGIIPVNPDYVRIPEMEGHFSSKPIGGRKVQMTFEVLLDPGGYIPAFLANFILKDIPLNSLQRFRRVINTERFANYSADYIVLPEGWRQPQLSPQTP